MFPRLSTCDFIDGCLVLFIIMPILLAALLVGVAIGTVFDIVVWLLAKFDVFPTLVIKYVNARSKIQSFMFNQIAFTVKDTVYFGTADDVLGMTKMAGQICGDAIVMVKIIDRNKLYKLPPNVAECYADACRAGGEYEPFLVACEVNNRLPFKMWGDTVLRTFIRDLSKQNMQVIGVRLNTTGNFYTVSHLYEYSERIRSKFFPLESSPA